MGGTTGSNDITYEYTNYWLLTPTSQDYNLAGHITHIVCLHKRQSNLQGSRCVSSWLIRPKARVRIPDEASKRNMKKIFLRRFLLIRFLAKSLRVNKHTYIIGH